jgi:hypothetical protein
MTRFKSRKENTMTPRRRSIAKALFFTVVAATGLVSGLARADVEGIDRNVQAQLSGQEGDLRIDNRVLTGHLGGGAYEVNIGPDRAKGTGPMGPIDLRLTRVPAGYDVQGIWNGGAVHFQVGARSVKGKAVRHLAGGTIGSVSCHYDIVRGQSGFSGLASCMGMRTPSRFQLSPRLPADLSQPQNVVLLVAYLAAPAAVR